MRRPAGESGHADKGPMAAVNLGVLLMGLGRFDEAEAAYRQAIESRHPEVAPVAEQLLRTMQD
jgi:tetratricopeptide (TPR) repeat protein